MKEKITKAFKKKIFIMVVLSISFFVIGAKAAQIYYANEISYTPADTNWSVSNVDDALNSLYSMKTELKNLKSIGTATASDILSGKTALVGGTTITGTMTNRGTLNWNPSSSTSYTVPAGYYSGGTISTSNAYNTAYIKGQENDSIKVINCGTLTASWTSLGSSYTGSLDVNSILTSQGLGKASVNINNFKFTITSMSAAFWGKESNWKSISISYSYNQSTGIVSFTRTSVYNSDTSMEINPAIKVELIY